jgi:hypothetical protein
MGTRPSRDDYDDRPRRDQDEDDDDDERPTRGTPRKSGASKNGLMVGLLVGGVVIVCAIVGIVMLVGGGANISYEKFEAITASDTIETLEKKFGKAKKLEKSEWSSIRYTDEGAGGRAGLTLADLSESGVDDWYHWHSGSQDLYVAIGKDWNGRVGLAYKVYTNSNAMSENNLPTADPNHLAPNFDARPLR